MKKKKRVRKIYIDLNFSAIKLITIFPSICSIFKKEKKITIANRGAGSNQILVGQIVTDCPFLFLFLQNAGGQMLTMPTCFRRL